MEIWSTEGVPPPQQFNFWREVICEAFAALDPRPLANSAISGLSAFPSRVALCPLGEVNGARIESDAQEVVRDFDQIRLDAQDRLFVNLQVSGVGQVTQGDRSSIIRPGCFSVVDTARPYTLRFADRFEVLSFRVPRQMLLSKVHAPAQLFAREIDGTVGLGRLTAGFMHNLLDLADSIPADAGNELAAQLCDLVALSARLGRATNLSTLHASQDRFVHDAKRHIELSLANPDLSVATVAQRFSVSMRYVHKAFAETGTTAAAYVRTQRLRRCAQDLANTVDHRSVSAIATRWGFRDMPQFTRLFVAAFDCPPLQYRKRAASLD